MQNSGNKALPKYCNWIYGSIPVYNKDKKEIGIKNAEYHAEKNFRLIGEEFKIVRDEYKEYMTPEQLEGLDSVYIPLHGFPESITKDSCIRTAIYKYICKMVPYYSDSIPLNKLIE